MAEGPFGNLYVLAGKLWPPVLGYPRGRAAICPDRPCANLYVSAGMAEGPFGNLYVLAGKLWPPVLGYPLGRTAISQLLA